MKSGRSNGSEEDRNEGSGFLKVKEERERKERFSEERKKKERKESGFRKCHQLQSG